MQQLVRDPLYAQLEKKLLEYIDSENLRMLPNEKELMTRYGISRNTLRRAIYELTQKGILQPVQGVGTIVYPQTEIVENSRILIVCNKYTARFQQEVFCQLFCTLNESKLRANVFMIDQEHVDEEVLIRQLQECDGVIIDQYCSFSAKIIDCVNRMGKRIVCMRWRPMTDNIPYVAEDVCDGFYQLANYLFELGHRDIAFIGHLDDPRRMPGIKRAFAEHNCPVNPDLFLHCNIGVRADGYRLAGKLLESGAKFTAVMGHSDETALGIEERLLIAGKRIPGDIAVTGFDNIADSADFPVPLTTCSGNLDVIIHETIAYLFSARVSQKMLNLEIKPSLVIRDSTAPAGSK